MSVCARDECRMRGDSAETAHVCYLVSHGFAARMILQSTLIPELASRGIRTTLLCPDGADGELQSYARDGVLSIQSAAFRLNRLTHGQMTELRRYLREPLEDNAALWSRHLYNRNASKGWIRRRADLFLMLHRLAWGNRPVQACLGAVDRMVHRCGPLRRQLAGLRPDLVVSTYPVSAFESSCLLEAQTLQIPTVGHLLSWDNITCKGRFVAVPEWFVAWGPIMTAELEDHYQVPADRVFECGVPHFDAHLELSDDAVRNRTVAEMGLDPDRPWLFFGMSSPIFAPREIDIVERLAREVQADRFGPDMQLVVRPHPQNVTGYTADQSWLPRLEALRSSRVGLNMPQLVSGQLAWNMQQEDLTVLVSLLGGCSVCLNSGSTLSIDALFHRKPVIVTFFDGDDDLPEWQSARRIRRFPHYEKLLKTGGVIPVLSFEELFESIQACLDDPDATAASRDFALRQECGPTDGQAAGRVADALKTILQQQAAVPAAVSPNGSAGCESAGQ